jgi:Fungal Zn(2)-Cys(6) binuclear cluster domain
MQRDVAFIAKNIFFPPFGQTVLSGHKLFAMDKTITRFSRTTQACDGCTQSRKKCDGKIPCSLCAAKTRPCTYSKLTKKRGPIASKSMGPLSSNHSRNLNYSKTLRSFTHSLSLIQKNPVAKWSRNDFLNTRIIDSNGISNTILELYFSYTHQHIPLMSKIWIQENLNDVPIYILHAMYAAVLVNANQALSNGRLIALPHAEFVKNAVRDGIDNCDPFIIAALINMAVYDFYLGNSTRTIHHVSVAVKLSQILGLDRDADLKWPSSASGRMMGNEIGMDKQFLRSLWLMLYIWVTHHY